VTTLFNDTSHTASKGRKSVNYELEEMWNAGQCHSQQPSRGTEWNPRTREYKHSIAKHSNATFDVEWEIENKVTAFQFVSTRVLVGTERRHLSATSSS